MRTTGSPSGRRDGSSASPAPEQCRDVLFIGTMLRPPLTQIRLDWQSVRLMPRVVRFFRGGDDRLLSGLASLMEDGGLRIIGIKEAAPEIIVQSGVPGCRQPSARDRADIAYALKLIAVLGPFDVGQAAVVADHHVLRSKRRKAPTICSPASPTCGGRGAW